MNESELIHLPYGRDLTKGGIAYALHALPRIYYRTADTVYDRLRRTAAQAAVELAFRRYLSQQGIPFEVRGAAPFTEPDRYDVLLGGRRCEIKTFVISHREQIAQVQLEPGALLRALALVASDQHAGAGHSPHDLYLFAFVAGSVTASQNELQRAVAVNQPFHLIHVLPEEWIRPTGWNPLGRLALKSDADDSITLEIGGQAAGREMRSQLLELPARTRLEIQEEFFSLAYIHARSCPSARIGLYSPVRRQTHLIGVSDWSNIWVYGSQIILAGYLSHREFSSRATFVPAGSRVFQHQRTQVKNLAVPVSDLKPLAQLLERVRE